MRAGFKFPVDITAEEITAFRDYQRRVKVVMQAYQRTVDKLNADYDMALNLIGDTHDAELEKLSQMHDQERLSNPAKSSPTESRRFQP